MCCSDSAVKTGVITATTETHADNIGTVCSCPVDTIYDIGGRTATAAAQYLDRHDHAVPGNTGHTDAVVTTGGSNAGTGSTVHVIILGIGIVVYKIVTFGDTTAEFGMIQIDTCIENGDNHTGSTGGNIPGLWTVDITISSTDGATTVSLCLTCVVMCPLGSVVGIVRRNHRMDDVVGVSFFDGRDILVEPDQVLNILWFCKFNQVVKVQIIIQCELIKLTFIIDNALEVAVTQLNIQLVKFWQISRSQCLSSTELFHNSTLQCDHQVIRHIGVLDSLVFLGLPPALIISLGIFRLRSGGHDSTCQ